MNPPCLMSHVAMCIASSIPTKAVTLVVFHQGFVDGVLEVWRKIFSMPSHKKKVCVFFYLPGCSCSTFLKTTPELPEHQHLSYLNIKKYCTCTWWCKSDHQRVDGQWNFATNTHQRLKFIHFIRKLIVNWQLWSVALTKSKDSLSTVHYCRLLSSLSVFIYMYIT